MHVIPMLYTQIFFVSLILMNYIFWAIGIQSQSLAALVLILLLISGIFLLIKIKNNNINIFFISMLIASFGLPCWQWDAQTIWLFHAKRIFFDMNLYSQLDGYDYCCMNDYPNMVPSLSASIAKSFNIWNEIIPKLSSIFFIFIPVIILTNKFKHNVTKTIFLIMLLFFGKKFLINGYIDALLAINFVSLLVLLDTKEKNNLYIILAVITACLIVLMKNEGILLYLISIIALFLSSKWGKILILLPMPLLIYFTTWKYQVGQTDIQNFMNIGFHSIDILTNRLTNREIFIILKSISLQLSPYVLLWVGVAVITNKRISFDPFNILFLSFIGYFSALTIIYLVTPVDLTTHIGQSIDRITMPLQLILIISLLINFEKKLRF
jgi:hypothetical protein